VKKVLLGSVMVMALTGVNAANAADLPLKAPPPVYGFTWNGFYVGGTAGGAWSNSDFTETPTGAFLLPAAIGGGLPPGLQLRAAYDCTHLQRRHAGDRSNERYANSRPV
jgi:opacity protein-like surface antigen